MIYLNVPKKPLKLDKLHQHIMIIPWVEPLGLCLYQRRHAKFQVSLPSIGLDLLFCQDLAKVKDVLAVSSVRLHHVEVHLPGSIDLGPLRVKGGANLDEGMFRNAHLIPLLCKELFHCYSQRHRCGRARR
jgi:hypothetical protein